MALDAFTTEPLVRDDAGFSGNSNVTDDIINQYVNAANGEVSTSIASNYVVPLSTNDNYDNSSTQNYLQYLATNLAAGLLLLKQYEGQGGDMVELALAKIESARNQLMEIQNGRRALVGSDGAMLLRSESNTSSNTGPVSGLPSSSTSSVFAMDDVF